MDTDLSLTSRLAKELMDASSRLGDDYVCTPNVLYVLRCQHECSSIPSKRPLLASTELFGAYFVQKGVYKGAIVKFSITVAEEYPLLMTPLINILSPKQILLDDLTTPDNSEFPILGPIDSWWTPSRHTLLSLLDYIISKIHDYTHKDAESEFLVLECVELSKENAFKRAAKGDMFYMEGSFGWDHEEIREAITRGPVNATRE